MVDAAECGENSAGETVEVVVLPEGSKMGCVAFCSGGDEGEKEKLSESPGSRMVPSGGDTIPGP